MPDVHFLRYLNGGSGIAEARNLVILQEATPLFQMLAQREDANYNAGERYIAPEPRPYRRALNSGVVLREVNPSDTLHEAVQEFHDAVGVPEWIVMEIEEGHQAKEQLHWAAAELTLAVLQRHAAAEAYASASREWTPRQPFRVVRCHLEKLFGCPISCEEFLLLLG